MASNKVIARLLKIKECKLIDVSFHHDQIVRLYVKPYKNGCLCPECGRRGTIIRSRPEAREWRDLKVGGWQVRFVYAPREIHCVTHGRVQEHATLAQFARTYPGCESFATTKRQLDPELLLRNNLWDTYIAKL